MEPASGVTPSAHSASSEVPRAHFSAALADAKLRMMEGRPAVIQQAKA
jgi:hypothetical protein